MTEHSDRCPSCFEPAAGSPCRACGWQPGADNQPPFLPIGALLDGRYRLGRVLGHGGFGITYLAFDENLALTLAIKEYLPRDCATRGGDGVSLSIYSNQAEAFDYGLARFIDEARALARFDQHPGVVGVKNFFRAHGTGYIVMDFVPGITLKEYLERQPDGRIAFDLAVRLLLPVMDALRAVHTADLLHRDIAPDNIRITPKGQVRLLDFGAARQAAGEHSRSLSIILKPGYAPPEQYRSRGKQGPWTDVYALAATLYRGITGRTPPEALDRAEEDDLVPPSRLGIAIPPAAEAALLKALAVKVAERTQDIRAFQDGLQRQVEEKPKPVPPKHKPDTSKIKQTQRPRIPKSQPKPRRTPSELIIGWLVVALILGITVMLILQDSQQDGEYGLGDPIVIPDEPTRSREPFEPEMVRIPAGRFLMGCDPSKFTCDEEELPPRWVDVPAFELAIYETTLAQWNAFGRPGGGRGSPDEPAIISFDEAEAYVDWLSKTTGKEYRLPTEAEWEYAARAGTTTAFYWGDSASEICRYANGFDLSWSRHFNEQSRHCEENMRAREAGELEDQMGEPSICSTERIRSPVDCDDGAAWPAVVGNYEPNAFGLYDTSGNAKEWVEGCWHPDPAGTPVHTNASHRASCGDYDYHLARGGGSWSSPSEMRSFARNRVHRYGRAGLRVARSLKLSD